MEWVEITGRTVEEAKDAALDQLGVDTVDAEFEILEEPSRGLFGKTKGQARVRARIAPTRPRPKVERRDRRKKSSGTGGGRNKAQRPAEPATDAAPAAPASNGKRPNRRSSGPKAEPTEKENTTVTETVDVDLAEHSRIVTEFLDGLVDSFVGIFSDFADLFPNAICRLWFVMNPLDFVNAQPGDMAAKRRSPKNGHTHRIVLSFQILAVFSLERL